MFKKRPTPQADASQDGAGKPEDESQMVVTAFFLRNNTFLDYGYIVEASPRQDYMAEECRLILRFFSEHGRGAVVSAGSPSEASVRRDNCSQVEWARPHARWRYPALLPSRRASKRVRGPG